jgi:hypothetical protein
MKTFFNRNSKAYGENKDLFKYFLLKADYDSNGDGYIDITKLKSPSDTSYVKLTDNALLSVQLDRIDYLINNLQDQVTLVSGGIVDGIPYLNAPNEFEGTNIFADDVTFNAALIANETSTFNGVSTFNATVNIDADVDLKDANTLSLQSISNVLLRNTSNNMSDYLGSTYAALASANIFTNSTTFKNNLSFRNTSDVEYVTFDLANSRYTFGVNLKPDSYVYVRNGCKFYMGGGGTQFLLGTPDGSSVDLDTYIDNRVSTVTIPPNIELEGMSFNKDDDWNVTSQLTGNTIHENAVAGSTYVLGSVPGVYHITFMSSENVGMGDDDYQPVYLLLSVGVTNIQSITEHKVGVTTAYNVNTGARYCIFWDGGYVKIKDTSDITSGINVLIQQTYGTF